MSLKKYLQDEVALDYSDGFISRREALRRLGMLGVSTLAATTMLAACAPKEDPGASADPDACPTPAGPPDPGPSNAVPTEAVNFPGPNGNLTGAWAAADCEEPRGAVLVIHENRGLTDFAKSVSGRLARDGFSGLSIDLLSEEGGTGSFADPAEAMAALARVPQERFTSDMKAGVDELVRRLPETPLAIVGFCFGGGQVWRLLAAGEPRLKVAVPFYGPCPEAPDFGGSKAAVLGVYGELDENVNRTQGTARDALARAGLTHEIKVYPGAQHGFFNDTGQRYHAEASKAAYADVLSWFGEHLV